MNLITGRWYWVLVTTKLTNGAEIPLPNDPTAWVPLKWDGSGWTNEDCFTDYAVVVHAWKLIPLATELT